MNTELKVNRNKLALLYGLIAGFIYIVLLSAENIFVSSMFMFYVTKIVGFVLYMLTIGILAKQIRKALGGYMDFKTAFSVIFIMILISELMYYVYNYIYIMYIDPQFLDKIKESTMAWMEKRNLPQPKLEEAAAKFDQQAEEAKHFSLGKNLLQYFSFVVLDSLVGLIITAIIKKNKPFNMA